MRRARVDAVRSGPILRQSQQEQGSLEENVGMWVGDERERH